jgi:hypothetical protein
VEFLQTSEDRGEICDKFRWLGVRFTWFIEFPNVSSMEKPVDRVHSTVDPMEKPVDRVHGGPSGRQGQ